MKKQMAQSMRFRTLTCVIAMTLFATLAVPVRVAGQEQRYRLIDLGTFGGPASTITGGGGGTQILNNRGMVTGGADTAIPDPNAPNCANPDCFLFHAFKWQKGVLTDLGTLPGGSVSSGTSISGNGLIAGASDSDVIDPLTGLREVRAVLWSGSQIINLGTLEGGNFSGGIAVNDRGQVVGIANNATPDSFSGVGTQVRTFLWDKGVMQDLGTLGGPDSPPFGNTLINERGQVAGASNTDSTPNPLTGVPTTHPFLWEKGTMSDLGTLGGTVAAPFSMNNRGQVVGASSLAGEQTVHPFLWSQGVLTDLGTLGGDNGVANKINNAGEVVGQADFPGSQLRDAVLWNKGAITDLGLVKGDTCSGAWSINSKGQVVGHSGICGVVKLHAFLWENGGPMIDLNTRIPLNSPLQLVWAFDINDHGEIAGLGVPPGVPPEDVEISGHAYVLIPCHENDAEGCKDRAEGIPAGAQSSQAPDAPVTQAPAARTQSRPTPNERVASFWGRWANRYRSPGAGPKD